MVSVRTCQKLPLCLIKPMPADSRMILLLAKAEPIRNDNNVSVITYVRRKEKSYCTDVILRRAE